MTSISDTNVVNAPGGLVELASVQRTSNNTTTAASVAAATNIFSSNLTFVADGSPVLVEFYAPGSYLDSVNGSFQYVFLTDGGNNALGYFWVHAYTVNNNQMHTGIYGKYRYVPAAGSVVTLNARATTSGTTGTILGGNATGGALPIIMRVSKIIQASQLIVQTPNAPLVTSLPSNAIDGQEVRYLADNTNGIIWNFRYRAGSSSTYKWEFIGGVPLFSSYRMTETADSTTSNTYVDLGGPSIVAPLAGDYDVIITGNYYAGAASGAAFMSVNFGGATTLDDDGILFAQAAQYSHQESRKKIRKLNTITSGMTVGTRYRTYSGSTQSNFRRRTIELIPIRVSA